MENLEPRVREALQVDMTVDITTTGRKTGQDRRIEIWAHCLDGRVFIAAMPGRRSWYANLVANPEFSFHLKQGVSADLRATARPITDASERRTVLTSIKEQSGFDQRRAMNVDEWVKGSCLVEVRLDS